MWSKKQNCSTNYKAQVSDVIRSTCPGECSPNTSQALNSIKNRRQSGTRASASASQLLGPGATVLRTYILHDCVGFCQLLQFPPISQSCVSGLIFH